jgi:hypothetical protein
MARATGRVALCAVGALALLTSAAESAPAPPPPASYDVRFVNAFSIDAASAARTMNLVDADGDPVVCRVPRAAPREPEGAEASAVSAREAAAVAATRLLEHIPADCLSVQEETDSGLRA